MRNLKSYQISTKKNFYLPSERGKSQNLLSGVHNSIQEYSIQTKYIKASHSKLSFFNQRYIIVLPRKGLKLRLVN